uniref:TIL domain-containing protein n=1 Tax=Anopheles stephensi TaxID=30069 RepID=A0A182XWY8_ANOST
MRFKITVPFLLLVFSLAQAKSGSSLVFSDPCKEKRTCPKNEVFICCGPCNEPTCSKPKQQNSCPDLCVAGCFCKPDYIRRVIGGPCVLANSCPKPRKSTKKP